MKNTFGVCKLSYVAVLVSALVLGVATPVRAQWQPVVKGTAKTLTKKAPAQAAKSASAQAAAARSLTPAAQKAMSDNNKRLYYSLMTKVGVSKRKALNYLYKHGAQPTSYPMPRLSGEVVVLNQLQPPSYQEPLPPYPFTSPKRVFYRGISINEEGLRNILQNGLRAKDSGAHHSDFSVLTYQTKALVDLANQAVGETKNICLISDSRRAEHYAVRRAEGDGKVPLMIQVKNTIPTVRNPAGAGVLSMGDIPTDQIVRISALLPVDGTPVWGDISMTQTGEFVFKPYAAE